MRIEQETRARDLAHAAINTGSLDRLWKTNAYFKVTVETAAAHFALLVDALAEEAERAERRRQRILAVIENSPLIPPAFEMDGL